MNAIFRWGAAPITALILVVTPFSNTSALSQDLEPPPEFLGEWRVNGGPVGLAIDDQDIIYVVTRDYSDLQKFSTDGTYLGTLATQGSGPGQLYEPNDIAIGPDGLLYIADGFNHRIQVLTRSGDFVRQWGSLGTGDGQFNHPHGVKVDRSGKVFVVDYQNSRIQVFTSAGVFLYKWGSQGAGPGQFYFPIGIAIDASDNVYVTDNTNYRVQKFTNGGVFLGSWACGSNNSIPHGIVFDGSGNAYVVIRASLNRIDKYTADGNLLTTWGTFGSGPGQLYDAEGIAIDRHGMIYVADKANWRIEKFGYLATSVQSTTWSRIKMTFSNSRPDSLAAPNPRGAGRD